jgi:hypothetical protein
VTFFTIGTRLFFYSTANKHTCVLQKGFWRARDVQKACTNPRFTGRRLRIRIVSHRVVCVHSFGLGSCLLVRVYFFTDSSGYTLEIFLYVSVT